MMNYLKEQLALRRLKKRFRIYTAPDREFLRSARESFIALARQKAVGASAAVANFHIFRYVSVALILIVSMTGGLAVFAEMQDVSPTNPLYPLKRLSEDVRIAVTPPEQRLELRETYVDRRVKEIAILKAEDTPISTIGRQDQDVSLKKAASSAPAANVEMRMQSLSTASVSASPLASLTPKQVQVQKLTSDLRQETEKILDQAQELRIKKESKARICAKLISTLDQARQNESSSSAGFVSRIKARCAQTEKGDR